MAMRAAAERRRRESDRGGGRYERVVVEEGKKVGGARWGVGALSGYEPFEQGGKHAENGGRGGVKDVRGKDKKWTDERERVMGRRALARGCPGVGGGSERRCFEFYR